MPKPTLSDDALWVIKPLVWVQPRVYIERLYYTPPTVALGHPDAVASFLRGLFQDLPHERLLALYGDASLRLIGARVLGEGTHGSVMMDSPALLRGLAFTGASAVVLAHNHPSDIVKPSPDDNDMTRKVARLCHAADAQLIDHLILPNGLRGYYSYAGEGHPALKVTV